MVVKHFKKKKKKKKKQNYDFQNRGEREDRLLTKLFPIPGTVQKDSKGRKSGQPDELLISAAIAPTPPWPADGHTATLVDRLPGRDGKKMVARRELAEQTIFGRGTTKATAVNESQGDTLTCEKLSGIGNSLWKVTRTDVVTGQKIQRLTHTDPLTPPRSPTEEEPNTLLLPKDFGMRKRFQEDETIVELEVPDWLLEVCFCDI